MWESLLALGVLGAKIVYDKVSSVRQKADDVVRAAARAVIPRVIAIVGDDQVRAHQMFRSLLEPAMRAVGLKPTASRLAIADAIFRQLWDAHERQTLDDGLAALASAGAKASKLADYLMSAASDPFASLRPPAPPPPQSPAQAVLAAEARRLREQARK